MNTQHRIKVQYAHCTKFTPGQLDCAPHSTYELREQVCILSSLEDVEENCTNWLVSDLSGSALGNGESPNEAIADAAYRLMNNTRTHASYQGWCRNNLKD